MSQAVADSMKVVPPITVTDSIVGGPDLVVNGDFAADTDWTKGTGWTIGSGTANKAAGVGSDLSQDISAVEDTTYVVEYDISGRTAGTLTPDIGGTNGTARSINDSFRELITGGASDTLLRFEADSSFDGSIDNVVIRKFSNVLENDNPEWVVGSYALGEVFMVAVDTPDIHRNFESLVGSNTTNPVDDQPPPLGTGTGANWLNLGATNRWAMLDTVNGTQTTNAESIEIGITPGQIINAIAVLNVNAATVQVIVTDPTESVVYDRTQQLISNSGINDWYAYFFTPIVRQTDVVFLDLPAFSAASIEVIVTEPGGTAAVGVLAFGVQNNIGISVFGVGLGITDYSIKETDAFGNFTIVPRSFADIADYPIVIETSRVGAIKNLLSSLRTTPAIWIGSELRPETIVYGYYRDFDIVISGPNKSECNIEVEGLI